MTSSRIADLSIQVSHALVAAAAGESKGRPVTDRAFPLSNSDHRSYIGVKRDRFDSFVDAHLPVAIEDGEQTERDAERLAESERAEHAA